MYQLPFIHLPDYYTALLKSNMNKESTLRNFSNYVLENKSLMLLIEHGFKDLKKVPMEELVRLFGKSGAFYYEIARAIDNRPVDPNRIRKSFSTENTFETDLEGLPEILLQLKIIADELVQRTSKSRTRGRTLTLKIKFDDFEQITRSKSLPDYYLPEDIHVVSAELTSLVDFGRRGVRLLGLGLSNLEHNDDLDAWQLEIDFKYR